MLQTRSRPGPLLFEPPSTPLFENPESTLDTLKSTLDAQSHTQTVEMGRVERFGGDPRLGVFAPGEVLADRFRVKRFLGQGGMGQVFEAFDMELGASVALKAIRPEQSHNPAAAQRFKREVHLARQVTHGNVCRIFDLFLHHSHSAWGHVDRPVLFLTMELLAGESLAHQLKRQGPTPLAQALPLIYDMAAALDAAHRAGIVHRDFKSANVMLVSGDQGPRAIVTDFGLAHSPQDLESGSGNLGGGTPGYMAPELRQKAPVTPAADIYAFGVVLHELLTGHRPGAGPDEPLKKSEDHDPTQAPVWQAVIERCLDPEPQNRFQSAGEIHGALAEIAREEVAHRRFRRLLSRPVGLAVAAVLTLLAAAFSQRPLELSAIGHPDGPTTAILPAPELATFSDQQRSALFYAQGLDQLQRFDGVAARDLLRQAVNADRDAIQARAALAGALMLLASDTQAREVAWEAWELADGLSETDHLEVEARYRTTVREHEAAAQLYQRLMSRLPDRLDFGLELAWAQFLTGQIDQAEETLSALRGSLPLFEAAGDPVAAARIDLLEARYALVLSNFDKTLSAASRARDVGKDRNAPEVVGQALLLISDALWRQGHLEQASKTARRAQQILIQLGNQSGLAEVLRIRGNIALLKQDVETATHFYQKLIEISRRSGYDRGVFAGLHNLGLVHAEQGNLDKSQRTFNHFLNHARRRGVERVRLIALLNLTVVSRRQGDLEAAEAYAAKGYEAAKVGRPEAAAQLDQTMAGIRKDRGDLESSRQLLETSRRQMLDLGIDLGAAWVRVSQAENSLLRGQLEEAEQAYEQAGAVIRKLGVNDTFIRDGLGRLALAEGRPERAAEIARQTLQKIDSGASLIQKVGTLVLLATAELELGKLDQAQQSLDQARRLAGKHAEIRLRLPMEILSAKLTATRDPKAALVEAQHILAETLANDIVELQLEARLALGQIERMAHQKGIDQGDARLRALAHDAEQLGFLELARRAVQPTA